MVADLVSLRSRVARLSGRAPACESAVLMLAPVSASAPAPALAIAIAPARAPACARHVLWIIERAYATS